MNHHTSGAGIITAAKSSRAIATVHLERCIAQKRMFELQPHGCEPDWLWQFSSDQPCVWTMDRNGSVSRSWQWLDMVDWHDVAAIRMEYAHGHPIDPNDLNDAEDGWFGFAEPAPPP